MICAHFFTQYEKAYFAMAFLSQIVTADEPEPNILNRRQKGCRTRNGTDRAYKHLFVIGGRL
jgi:hypothetical protein